MWFKKKVKLSDDFVELSIGRVYYKPLLNTHVRIAENNSNNWKIYCTLIEINLLDISTKQYASLTVADGQKIRKKTIEILKRHDIVDDSSDVNNQWSATDKKWFEEQYQKAQQKIIDSTTGKI